MCPSDRIAIRPDGHPAGWSSGRMDLYITKPCPTFSILYNIQDTLYLNYSHSGRRTKYAPTNTRDKLNACQHKWPKLKPNLVALKLALTVSLRAT
ncbi:hypothetical protein Hanom_Chr10g00927331 [Helianthus anomalus]